MKKLIVLILLFSLISTQGCHVKRKIQKYTITKDSVHLKTSDTFLKNDKKDISTIDLFNRYFKNDRELDITADKVTKRVETSESSNMTFVLNVDKIKAAGDSAIATDVQTGTTAIIYKDTDGQVKFNIKQLGKKSETFEMAGLKLKSKNSIDSGTVKQISTNIAVNNTTANNSSKDSNRSSLNQTSKNKEVKQDFGILKTIGLILVVVAIARVLIYFLRKQWPWMGILNNFLSFKKAKS